MFISRGQKSRDYINILPGIIFFFDNFTYLENVNHAMQNIQLAEQWLQFYPEQRISSETTVDNSPVGSSALL